MKKVHYKHENYVTTTWAGGKTTQFFLLPEGSDFQKRQFDLRISSATIEVEESLFSDFKGYQRCITTLDHSIVIQHNGQKKEIINPYQLHFFSGADKTVSFGRCVDFNVIYRDDFSIEINWMTTQIMPLSSQYIYLFVFFTPTTIAFEESETQSFEALDCLLVEDSNDTLKIKQLNSNVLVIQYKKKEGVNNE